MLRLLAIAAGAYWLRKPENRRLAKRKLMEGWDSVVNGTDKRRRDVTTYHDSQRPDDITSYHDSQRPSDVPPFHSSQRPDDDRKL